MMPGLTNIRSLLLFLVALLCFASPYVASVVIINHSPTGFPDAGDVVYVQGEGFGIQPQVIISGPNHAETSAQIVSTDPQSVSVIQFIIPNDWYLEAYSVKIRTSSSEVSAAITINRPFCQQFDMYEVLPSSSMKLYGENLYFGDPWRPKVYFIQENTEARLEAEVDLSHSDDHVLTVITPSGLENNAQYTVLIDNHLGATTRTLFTVTARVGKDYLGIGVGWSVNFSFIETNVVTLNATTDGTYDMFPDIQIAINTMAQAGGGMLVLSAGEFRWRSCKSLQLHSNIVIKGAGVNRTTIVYGYCNSTGSWIYSSDPTTQNVALIDLTLTPADFNGGFTGSAIGGGSALRNIVLARLYLDLKGADLSIAATNLLLQDVVATAQSLPFSGWSSGYRFGCSTNALFRRVWLYFENGYMTSSFMKNGVLEDFHLIRDSRKQFREDGVSESRMWSCNFCENIVVDRSQFETLHFNFSKDNNDGETILTEGGGPKRGEFGVGVVSSASDTTLTDLTADWTLQTTSMAVTITDGPGFGQTRRIVSTTANTLTVDEPWTSNPTSQSRYSFGTPGFVNWLIKDTLLKGNPRGIWLYASSGLNITIVRNTFINGAGIDYRPFQRAFPNTSMDICGQPSIQIPYPQQQVTQVFQSRIVDNLVYADIPEAMAQIRVTGNHLSAQDTFTRGTSIFGVEIRGNNITRVNEQVSPLPSYMTAMCFQQQVGLPNATLYSVVGTILQDNHVQGVAQMAYGFGSNIASTIHACNSGAGRVADTFALDVQNCRFYPSQSQDVHVLADQCRSTSYLPPAPPSGSTPDAGTPRAVSAASGTEFFGCLIAGVLAWLSL